jgi:hypothetical protein
MPGGVEVTERSPVAGAHDPHAHVVERERLSGAGDGVRDIRLLARELLRLDIE